MVQANSLSMERVVFQLHISPQELSWEMQKRTEKSGEGGGKTIRFELLEAGKAALADPETFRERATGALGKVLPRGRLPALMKYVKEPGEMDRLCWVVLRRYATYNHCRAQPQKSIRLAAYQPVKRGWERANVEGWLRHPPPDFFSGEVPPSDKDFWLLSQSLRLDDQGVEIYIGWQVEQLLDPAIRPQLHVLWMREL